MFIRVLKASFARSLRRKAMAVLAVALGTAVATGMLAVSLDVGDKMAREMRSFGANIIVTPAADTLAVEIGGVDYRPPAEGAFLRESDLPRLKTIFWRNNITGFAPYLYVPARLIEVGHAPSPAPSRTGTRSVVVAGVWFDHSFNTGSEKYRTGIRTVNPTWHVDGDWPDDGDAGAALAGRALGLRAGERVTLAAGDRTASFRITGLLTTGGPEDDQVLVPLAAAQDLANADGQVRKVQVSALIKPDDDFARRDPSKLTGLEYDRWYCTPYIGSITRQVQEALPGARARPVRQVAQNEGQVLHKIQWLMLLVTLAALAASALAISSATAAAVIERRAEIALMKALGCTQFTVSAFFFAEAALQGMAGGLLGCGAGLLMAVWISRAVFGAAPEISPLLLPLALLIALVISLAGGASPLRAAVRLSPATVLKEEK